MIKLSEIYMLLLALVLMAACSNSEPDGPKDDVISSGKGVFILCEGNYQAGNSTLSYYNPETRKVDCGIVSPPITWMGGFRLSSTRRYPRWRTPGGRCPAQRD